MPSLDDFKRNDPSSMLDMGVYDDTGAGAGTAGADQEPEKDTSKVVSHAVDAAKHGIQADIEAVLCAIQDVKKLAEGLEKMSENAAQSTTEHAAIKTLKME